MKPLKQIGIVLAIILIALGGYAIMHGSIYVLPLSQGKPSTLLFYTALVIILGLAIPYWILKLAVHKAHMTNPNEKEIELKDLPKDENKLKKAG